MLPSPTQRIARNTIILYIRMFIVTLISLYTSRVILKTLGIEDFGIYNIAGGVIAFFSVINSAMSSSTQRFVNVELGKNNQESFVKIFNTSVEIHLIIAAFILLIGETLGLYIYFNWLNIPDNRCAAGHIVYQFSLLSSIIVILKTPYNALVIAKERMTFFAYASIFEAITKLFLVLCLSIQPFDNLIIYAIGIFVINLILLSWIIVFCKKKLSAPQFLLVSLRSNDSRQMLKFSSWSLVGNVCNVFNSQGLNVLLNVYLGVALNAAVGITNQVTNTLSTFTTNFQVAYKPAIIQYYIKDKHEFVRLVCRSAKYSFFLLFLILYPFYFNIDFILQLWLGEVPAYSNDFIKVLVFSIFLSSINVPFYNVLEANGTIYGYQTTVAITTPLILIYSYFMLQSGFSPILVMLSHVFLSTCLLATSFILIYRMQILSLKTVLTEVFIPIIKVIVFAILMLALPTETGFGDIFFKLIIALCVVTSVGMDKWERKKLINFLLRRK